MNSLKRLLAVLIVLAPAIGSASTAALSKTMEHAFAYYTEHGATISCNNSECYLQGNVTAALPVTCSAKVQRGGYYLCRTAESPAVLPSEVFANLTITIKDGWARWPLECIQSAATSTAHERVPCRRIDYINYAKSVRQTGEASGTYLHTADDDADEAAGR